MTSKKYFKKPFNKKLFAENDKRAKNAAIKFFASLGRQVIENPFSEFVVDLIEVQQISDIDVEIINTIEVESKLGWKGSEYPFPTIRIPARKAKFKGSIFCVFNHDLSAVMIIPSEVMLGCEIELVTNKYSNGNLEEFLSVDPNDCDLYFISSLSEDLEDVI